MSDDILGMDLKEPGVEDWDSYQDASASKPLPPEGEYDVKLADEFKFEKSQDGFLMVNLDPVTLVGGEFDGREIRYAAKVSTRRYKNSNACSMGDVIRNVGTGTPRTNAEYVEAMKSAQGQIATKVRFVWEAYDKETQKSVQGMKNFPKREDGSYQSWIDVPDEAATNETKTRRVWANLRVGPRGFAPRKEKA
jgi:hypothetical protein